MAKDKLVNPAAALGEATRFADLRQRLFFLIGALIVYRIGTFIPVPGVDPEAMAQLSEPLVRPGGHLSLWLETDAETPEKLGRFRNPKSHAYDLPAPAARPWLPWS